MPFYVADYLGDTGHLTTLEHGAYLLLIMHYWRTEGLPQDDGSLGAIARLSPREWRGMSQKLAGLFQEGWRHKRIEEELEKFAVKSVARATAGRSGGLAKAKQANGKTVANARILPDISQRFALASSSESEPEPRKSSVVQEDNGRRAPPDPDAELFRRGKELLGKSAGGQIAKLKALFGGDVAKTRALLEVASTKNSAAEYVAAAIKRNAGKNPQFDNGLYDKGL